MLRALNGKQSNVQALQLAQDVEESVLPLVFMIHLNEEYSRCLLSDGNALWRLYQVLMVNFIVEQWCLGG